MSRIAPDVWARLAGERVEGENFWARRAAPDLTERLIVALDAEGRRHLLVSLLSSETAYQDSQSRGLAVATRNLAMPGKEFGRFLDIVCHDATGHDAFDLIGGELAERLAMARETAPEVVARVLSKWRRFWGQIPKQILSREEQLGLFAELWFLGIWLLPRIGCSEAIARWRGPYGARHDFEWVGKSVEVKATTSTRGHIHSINGLDQLVLPENGTLFLFSLRLREEAGASNTLPSIVDACREKFEVDADALNKFEIALVQAKYSPVHEDEYARMRLRIAEEGLYAVRGDFPRITPAVFPQGTPSGIEHVDYQINLGGFAHLRVARQPSEMEDN